MFTVNEKIVNSEYMLQNKQLVLLLLLSFSLVSLSLHVYLQVSLTAVLAQCLEQAQRNDIKGFILQLATFRGRTTLPTIYHRLVSPSQWTNANPACILIGHEQNLYFDDQSKQIHFIFCVAVFLINDDFLKHKQANINVKSRRLGVIVTAFSSKVNK